MLIEIFNLSVSRSKNIQIQDYNIQGHGRGFKIFNLDVLESKNIQIVIFNIQGMFGNTKTIKLKILTCCAHLNRSFEHPLDPTDGFWMLKFLIWRIWVRKTHKLKILTSRIHASLDAKVFDLEFLRFWKIIPLMLEYLILRL